MAYVLVETNNQQNKATNSFKSCGINIDNVVFIDTDKLPFGLSKDNAQNIRAIALLVSFWFLIFATPFLFFVINNIPFFVGF